MLWARIKQVYMVRIPKRSIQHVGISSVFAQFFTAMVRSGERRACPRLSKQPNASLDAQDKGQVLGLVIVIVLYPRQECSRGHDNGMQRVR